MDILLEWLSPDRATAEQLYMELQRRLVSIFHSFNDPEDLAAEAINRALNNIKAGKVTFDGKPTHYISKIASHVKLEEFRKKKTVSFDEEIKEPPAKPQDSDPREELYRIIEVCLDEALDEKDKELFLDYTFPPEDVSVTEYREILAAEYGISVQNLRVKIHRIRNILRDCADQKLTT